MQTNYLHKDYKVGDNVIHAVYGVDLEIKDGTFVAIMGKSGCGKTTLLHLIGGLDKGLLLSDIKNMELGQLIDFIVDYNKQYEKAERNSQQGKKRKATQADWDAFWG